MKDTERTALDCDGLGNQAGDPASSFICTRSVDKLAWRSKITTEESMAILQAAGMAARPHDRG
jgi:hypothetical protein